VQLVYRESLAKNATDYLIAFSSDTHIVLMTNCFSVTTESDVLLSSEMENSAFTKVNYSVINSGIVDKLLKSLTFFSKVFESRQCKNFLFSTSSRPALGPTQPPIQ
jgi:hypothetical protein